MVTVIDCRRNKSKPFNDSCRLQCTVKGVTRSHPKKEDNQSGRSLKGFSNMASNFDNSHSAKDECVCFCKIH